MEQVRTQAPQLKTLLDSSNQFYQDLLGYKPEQTSLQSVSDSQWGQFATQRGLNPNSSGIYLPRNQTAVIKNEGPLSLFHEYFGHGLYCEQSLSGRKLVQLERELLEEEKEEFKGRKFALEDIQKFRQQNPTFQELDEFRKHNLGEYELFAIWTEYFLSKENDSLELFERKYDGLNSDIRKIVDSVINFSESYGDLAAFYAQGMARRTTVNRVKRLLEDIYGDKIVNNSRLVLLTGSRKAFSDIDLFASSNYLQSTKNNWLDLVVFDEEDFERRISLFEPQITHPIMSGDFVVGDKKYLEQKINQLQGQPITEEAIQHNFRKAEKERIVSEETDDEVLRKVFSSYSQTYFGNALALREGLRFFTKEDLLSYSRRENLTQLKGGTEKNAT